MTGNLCTDNTKPSISASLLALTTTFHAQQQLAVHQFIVTPNEMFGLYCRDNPLNDPLSFLPGLSLALKVSLEKQITWG